MAGPGFAAWPKEKLRRLAKRAAKKNVHRYRLTPEKAREAGRKGAEARWRAKREREAKDAA